MKHLVHDVLSETAARCPQKTAVICDGVVTTYKDLVTHIEGMRTMLRDRGLAKGDRALILLDDKRSFLVACYGVMAAGGIAVPIHSGSSLDTISEIAAECRPKLLIAGSPDHPDLSGLVRQLRIAVVHSPNGRAGEKHAVFEVPDRHTRGETDSPTINSTDGALILYTSGTSGRKKGVLLSHKSLLQATMNINTFMNIDGDVREFVSVPLTHSFGFGRARCVFLVGGTVVFETGMLNPVTMTRSIKEYRCNALSAVPSGLAMFFGRFENLLSEIGRQVKLVELGSAPMPMEHKLKLMKLLPKASICMHYGLTEASRSSFIEFQSERGELHTVGRPSPNVEMTILSAGGVPQARGDRGEIAIRGAHVMDCYWNNPALTAEKITRDGWLKTGDFGFLDERGYLHLLGRQDDVINMGGIKISPLEIEEPLRSVFPNLDFCVIGYPDPLGVAGEIPVLCYVPSDSTVITETMLMSGLTDRVDRFKIPRMAISIDTLPKTQTQKVKRNEVKKLVGQKLSEEAGKGVRV